MSADHSMVLKDSLVGVHIAAEYTAGVRIWGCTIVAAHRGIHAWLSTILFFSAVGNSEFTSVWKLN